jgi:hypothetical protein
MQPGRARTIYSALWLHCFGFTHLSVVVSVRGGKVAAERYVGGILAEEWIRGAECVTGRAEHGVGPAGCGAALGAEAVQAESAGAAARQSKVRRAL